MKCWYCGEAEMEQAPDLGSSWLRCPKCGATWVLAPKGIKERRKARK